MPLTEAPFEQRGLAALRDTLTLVIADHTYYRNAHQNMVDQARRMRSLAARSAEVRHLKATTGKRHAKPWQSKDPAVRAAYYASKGIPDPTAGDSDDRSTEDA